MIENELAIVLQRLDQQKRAIAKQVSTIVAMKDAKISTERAEAILVEMQLLLTQMQSRTTALRQPRN